MGIGYQTQPSSAAASPISCSSGSPSSEATTGCFLHKSSKQVARIAFQERQFSTLDHMLNQQQSLLSSFIEERIVFLACYRRRILTK